MHTQPRKHVLTIDHAGHTAPIRQHDELDHTDQEYIRPEKHLDPDVGNDLQMIFPTCKIIEPSGYSRDTNAYAAGVP